MAMQTIGSSSTIRTRASPSPLGCAFGFNCLTSPESWCTRLSSSSSVSHPNFRLRFAHRVCHRAHGGGIAAMRLRLRQALVDQNPAHHGLLAVAFSASRRATDGGCGAFGGESLCQFIFLPQIRKLSALHRI